MEENRYDDLPFFERYAGMDRSQKGLEGAGEWYALKKMLPDFTGKDVLDLGCGFGWHCRYAIENGARSATGIDLSERMLEKAKEINNLKGIEYVRKSIRDVDYENNKFDVVLSSLAFHYIESFEDIVRKVYNWLRPDGSFVFSVEHPVFTAFGTQDWIYGERGEKLYWPVDTYFAEGRRRTLFLGEEVIKYHKTLTTYLNTLLKQGFKIREITEPEPTGAMLGEIPEMKEELRRPMMLLVSAEK